MMLKLFLLTTLLLPILSLKSPAPPTTPHTSPTVSILGPPSTPTVWTHFASLQTPQTLNLGQGYPSSSPPKFCLDSLKESIESSSRIHQYTASAGHPPLGERSYNRTEINPLSHFIHSLFLTQLLRFRFALAPVHAQSPNSANATPITSPTLSPPTTSP